MSAYALKGLFRVRSNFKYDTRHISLNQLTQLANSSEKNLFCGGRDNNNVSHR